VVLTFDNPVARKAQQLVVNGTSYANNFPPGRRYMSTLGHLPALLHPAPRSVVVIAIGTGTTVGSLTLNPAIDRLWAVDISRDVFELAPYFVPLNHQFMKSPKVRPVVADGRHFLLCTEEKFDVMTFEPPPPQEAGVVNLYSQDFYQLAKRRLAPGGILCQWVPLDLSHEVLGRMLLRTLQAEFPYVSLWIPARYEGVVLASMSPLTVDLDRLQKRMAEPGMRADMSAYGLGKPEQLLATFVTADEGLAAFTGDVPPITDNHPWTEYFLFFPRAAARFDQILAHRRPVEEYVFGSPLEGHTLEREKEVMLHLWYGYELERDGHYSAALARINQALQLEPDNPYLRYRSAYLERRLLLQRP
jgi:spermidine synthase